jgi:thiamine biosynthesis lipoprotein
MVSRLLVLASVVAAGVAARQHDSVSRFEAVEPHMGTLVRVTLYARSAEDARRGFRAAFDRIAALDATLSDYKADSELNRITRTAVGRWTAASRDLVTVLDASQRLARNTAGAFDITQGPVIRLWREARAARRLPASDRLEAASRLTGYEKLHVDRERGAVKVDFAGMALDVGAIGKGYAASEAVAALAAAGVSSALVAISGDLAFSGPPPGQRGWRVRLHDLQPSETSVPQVVELTHGAVSTAGPSEQHLDVGGRRYSHIVDPASRMGLTDSLTVTVVASHGLDADGLDTAISVVGVERGFRLIDARPDAGAFAVRREATTTAHASVGLRPLLVTGSLGMRSVTRTEIPR